MTTYISGNIFIRQGELGKAGSFTVGHKHNFDHTTYITRGSFLIEKLDEEENVIKSVTKSARDGYNWILIEEGVKHKITALEDDSMYHCIFSHRNPQGDILQEYDGWYEATT